MLLNHIIKFSTLSSGRAAFPFLIVFKAALASVFLSLFGLQVLHPPPFSHFLSFSSFITSLKYFFSVALPLSSFVITFPSLSLITPTSFTSFPFQSLCVQPFVQLVIIPSFNLCHLTFCQTSHLYELQSTFIVFLVTLLLLSWSFPICSLLVLSFYHHATACLVT